MELPYTLIPVSHLDRAKTRLAALLEPNERAELAFATLSTVWQAALKATAGVGILTSDQRIATLLGPQAVILPESPSEQTLSGQLSAAIYQLSAEGVLREDAAVLILHADLPLATPAAADALVRASPAAPSVTIVRSGDGGTNAMLMAPPMRFALAYGPNSAALHEAAARAAGMLVTWHDSPELALDLDTPADIEMLLRHPGGPATLAGKALARMDIRARLESAG